jgi:hypothetical protein
MERTIPKVPSEYCPDNWVLLEIKPQGGDVYYKVFGCWQGSYLEGDSWRINSGCESVKEDDNYYFFYGFSGSCYVCPKGKHNISPYCSGVLAQILQNEFVKVVPEGDIKSALEASGLLVDNKE